MQFDLEAELLSGCEAEWLVRPVSELTAHITAAYHERTRDVLPRVAAVVAQESSALGGERGAHLQVLAATLAELRDEVETHTWAEDDLLFPVLVAHEHPDILTTRLTTESLSRLVDTLAADHVRIRHVLFRLAGHMEHAPGAQFRPEWAELRHALMLLHDHLIEELDLEDRCLLPRARAIAAMNRLR